MLFLNIIYYNNENKYNYFYINGSSHCEGGGLEEADLRGFGVHDLYKKLYNVSWKNREEVNFGYRLSKLINVKCINESKSDSNRIDNKNDCFTD